MCKIFNLAESCGNLFRQWLLLSFGGRLFTRIISGSDKVLILLSFPPAWIRTNSIDFKDLVAVREECG